MNKIIQKHHVNGVSEGERVFFIGAPIPIAKIDSGAFAFIQTHQMNTQTHCQIINKARGQFDHWAQLLKLQRYVNMRHVGEKVDDACAGRGVHAFVKEGRAHNYERGETWRVGEEQYCEYDRIRLVNNGRFTAVFKRQLEFEAKNHKHDWRCQHCDCFDVPAEPVDPCAHAHQTHGLFQTGFFLVNYLFRGKYDCGHEAELNYVREDGDQHNYKVVLLIGAVRESFQFDVDRIHLRIELAYQRVIYSFLHSQKAFGIVALKFLYGFKIIYFYLIFAFNFIKTSI